MASNQNCGICFYFRGDQCRAEAPKAAPIPIGNSQIKILGYWPPVKPSDWCGQWRPDPTMTE